MKKIILNSILAISICVGCNKAQTQIKADITPKTLSNGFKYCEGSVAYGNSVLVSNFGSTELNPLNAEGKGYINQIIGDEIKPFIPADGNMDAPKGMAISQNYLYIADVGRVLVYKLENTPVFQTSIALPGGNLFANDIVIIENKAYVSVTNTGKIYTINISNPTNISSNDVSEFVDIIGANGLVTDGNIIYAASYPADGTTTGANVIYKISNLTNPTTTKLLSRPGQYDGLALKDNKLFFSNWENTEIGFIDLENNTTKVIPLNETKLSGPADICLLENSLYIPDLPASQIVVLDISNL